MSMNASAKSTDRGKRLSPSQKGKCSSSPSKVTKSETSKRGSKSCSPVATLDKYLIKKPEAGSLNKTNNNNTSLAEKRTGAKGELEAKPEGTAGSVNESNAAGVTKETSPDPEFIVVDDSPADLDVSSATKTNGSKREELSAHDPGSDSVNGKEEELSTPHSPGQQKQGEPSDSARQSSKPDDGNSTDDVQSEHDETETQEYDIALGDVARTHVDYKEEDFNTDSDFELDRAESERSRTPEEGKSDGGFQGKKKTAAMGGLLSHTTRKRFRENCEGSSSEEDGDRPWRSEKHHRVSREKRTSLRPKGNTRFTLRKQWSDRDTQEYRDGYPDKKDSLHKNLNIQFYQGKIRCKPDGAFIDDIHKLWWNNLDRLESHHGYIQWLFPIRESGMNYEAQELQLHEAKTIQEDQEALERFRKSYEMMLNFYGLKLVDRGSGQVKRADNWQLRFRHLNSSMHNYLRITRILKSLGEMGLEHYKPPLLDHLLKEAIDKRTLDRTLESCYNYWIGTVKDDSQRHRLIKVAEQGLSE